MPDSTPPSPRKPRLIGIATALMCALAGGAIWCLLSLRASGDLAAFSFLVAAAIAWVLRAHGYAAHWSGIVLAPALVALATAYALYLQAVARIASMLGVSIREAFGKMQMDFAFDVARAHLGAASTTIVLLAMLAAALAMLPRAR